MESGKIGALQPPAAGDGHRAAKPADRAEFLRILKEKVRSGAYQPNIADIAQIVTPYLDTEKE